MQVIIIKNFQTILMFLQGMQSYVKDIFLMEQEEVKLADNVQWHIGEKAWSNILKENNEAYAQYQQIIESFKASGKLRHIPKLCTDKEHFCHDYSYQAYEDEWKYLMQIVIDLKFLKMSDLFLKWLYINGQNARSLTLVRKLKRGVRLIYDTLSPCEKKGYGILIRHFIRSLLGTLKSCAIITLISQVDLMQKYNRREYSQLQSREQCMNTIELGVLDIHYATEYITFLDCIDKYYVLRKTSHQIIPSKLQYLFSQIQCIDREYIISHSARWYKVCRTIGRKSCNAFVSIQPGENCNYIECESENGDNSIAAKKGIEVFPGKATISLNNNQKSTYIRHGNAGKAIEGKLASQVMGGIKSALVINDSVNISDGLEKTNLCKGMGQQNSLDNTQKMDDDQLQNFSEQRATDCESSTLNGRQSDDRENRSRIPEEVKQHSRKRTSQAQTTRRYKRVKQCDGSDSAECTRKEEDSMISLFPCKHKLVVRRAIKKKLNRFPEIVEQMISDGDE